MLGTRQKVLRLFWYPVIPIVAPATGLSRSPCWLKAGALARRRRQPAAAIDRCFHRTLALSLRSFGRGPATSCAAITRLELLRTAAGAGVAQCRKAKVGASGQFHDRRLSLRRGARLTAWVALDAAAPGHPRISRGRRPGIPPLHQFYEVCALLWAAPYGESFERRNISSSFVLPRATFGDITNPSRSNWQMTRPTGASARSANPRWSTARHRQGGAAHGRDRTRRIRNKRLVLPFARRRRHHLSERPPHVLITPARPPSTIRARGRAVRVPHDTEPTCPPGRRRRLAAR